MKMRGRTELPEASLILTSVKPELKVGGTLQARTFLAPFGCEEVKVVHGEEEDRSAGTLGLVLEEEVTAPSAPKSDKKVEFGLGFSDELLRTRLMVVWELMRPSWCPIPNADSILRATQDVQRELNADCNLRDLNIIYHVMMTASRATGKTKWSCLAGDQKSGSNLVAVWRKSVD